MAEAHRSGRPGARTLSTVGGRSLLRHRCVAQRRCLLGAITVYRQEVRPFTEKQIALVTELRDQAVIAIENARLLNELRERTDELARSVEELKALSEVGQAVSSTLDLGAVLSTILDRSVGLTGADAGAIFRYSRRSALVPSVRGGRLGRGAGRASPRARHRAKT